MIAERPVKTNQPQLLTLLSPEMPQIASPGNFCLLLNYALEFSSAKSSFEVKTTGDGSSLLWGVTGYLEKLTNEQAYIDLPETAKRIKFVAELNHWSENITIKSVTVFAGNCTDMYDSSDMGKLIFLYFVR